MLVVRLLPCDASRFYLGGLDTRRPECLGRCTRTLYKKHFDFGVQRESAPSANRAFNGSALGSLLHSSQAAVRSRHAGRVEKWQ